MSTQPPSPPELPPDYLLSASASTLRSYHFPEPQFIPSTVSAPSDPPSRTSPDNSPPDSPLSGSISSLPSVSSSFFFSSAAASPPHPNPPQLEHTSSQGLIIPSLRFPRSLRHPTPYGQTLGDLRVLVIGRKGTASLEVAASLLDDNEEVVEHGSWEETEHGHTLGASTDWIEHNNGVYGLEKFEPLRNVELTVFPGYDFDTNVDELVASIRAYIQKSFYSLNEVLHPKHRASPVLSSLLSSPCTPLCTALVFLLPPSSALDYVDRRLISEIGPFIPIIVLPSLSTGSYGPAEETWRPMPISSFRPATLGALRSGLFHSPETLSQLRSQAADRFLRWREIECAVADIFAEREGRLSADAKKERWSPSSTWDKAKWESEWMPNLSVDVAKRMRQGTITQRTLRRNLSPLPGITTTQGSATYDPLHLPSLVIFSMSLLSPLKDRLDISFSSLWDALGEMQVRVALIGGFFVGIGVGLVVH
ncbi:hypothetical protein AMATHDRAFT_143228 [Amanita thiersii Skay4041]|uniref:Septin-type G domain-containing protein n=1 Tax=Amanita thiersii Skay4041 TaxID=703135 RepID=A0A2A9NKS5_9AGAR|nr:hypothetical protein AMATHDRAFT_143228 [Amanita thiersii Skay4041]